MQFNNSGDGKYFQQLLCQKNIRACMMYDVGCVNRKLRLFSVRYILKQ